MDMGGAHSWRVIYMDGRPHPKPEDLRPTFLGHSIGHWEGDTLVVDSVGFNEKIWVDRFLSHHQRSSILPNVSRGPLLDLWITK